MKGHIMNWVQVFLLTIIALVMNILFPAWLFMLTIGAIHSEWIPALPTIGFSASLLVTVLIGLFVWCLNFKPESE